MHHDYLVTSLYSKEIILSIVMINVTIGIVAGLYAVRRKDALSYMTSLFLYITFHYTYSVFSIFDYNAFFVWRKNTQQGAKIIGLLFIVFIIVELYRKYVIKKWRYVKSPVVALPVFLSIVWVLFTFVQWGLNLLTKHPISRIALQDTGSAIIMLLLVAGFCMALLENDAQSADFWIIVRRLYPIILIAMFLIAAYQIAFSRVFAAGLLPNGEVVLRACAFLFNPNVLGFWSSLTVFFISYAYHSGNMRAKFAIPSILIAGLCIFLSGSRSCFLICGFFLITSVIFIIISRKLSQLWQTILPTITLSGATLFFFSIIKMMEWITSHKITVIHSMSLLVDRFISIPFLILHYSGMVLQQYFPELGSFVTGLISVPQGYVITEKSAALLAKYPEAFNVYSNLAQRLTTSSGLADNGFIAIYEDCQWLGLLPWCFLWVSLIWLGLRAFYLKPDVNSGYAVTAVLGCAFSAFGMRLFQVFPFWILVALCLGPAFYLILSVLEENCAKTPEDS